VILASVEDVAHPLIGRTKFWVMCAGRRSQKKKEKAVLENRAAEIPAELVEMVGLFGLALRLGDRIGGIETAVAEELEPVPWN